MPAIRFNQCRLFTERHIWGWTRTPVPPWLALRSQDGGGGSCWARIWGPAHEKFFPRGLGMLGGRPLSGLREAGGTEPAIQYHFPQQPRLCSVWGGGEGSSSLSGLSPGASRPQWLLLASPTGAQGDRELQGRNPLQAWCMLGCGHPHRWACSVTSSTPAWAPISPLSPRRAGVLVAGA